MLHLSLEFFPPKTDSQAEALLATVGGLAAYRPDFVSVTYGANGSTRERSLGAVAAIMARTGLDAAAHLTCVGVPRAATEAAARAFIEAGVRRFVALRGDPLEGVGHRYSAHPEGFQTTAELVRWLRTLGDIDVSVAAYPERHPESATWDDEIATLRAKREAGAARAITQFFFDRDAFLAYRDRVAAAGIDVAIVPGIMPVHRLSGIVRFSERCGASVPRWLHDRFAGLAEDGADHRDAAVALAVEQIEALRRDGVDEFHIYTMNRADLTTAILDRVGRATARPDAAVRRQEAPLRQVA